MPSTKTNIFTDVILFYRRRYLLLSVIVLVTFIGRVPVVNGSNVILHKYKKSHTDKYYNEILNSNSSRNEFKPMNEIVKSLNNRENNLNSKLSVDKFQNILIESNSLHDSNKHQIPYRMSNDTNKTSVLLKNEFSSDDASGIIIKNKTKINDDKHQSSSSLLSSAYAFNMSSKFDIVSKLNNNSSSHSSNVLDLMESNKGISHFEKLLLKYLEKMLIAESYELISGVLIEPNNNQSLEVRANETINNTSMRKFDSFDKSLLEPIQRFINRYVISINVPRAIETGRLFFFRGLKKILWPIFIGVQIAKTILLALFLPSILGSLGKIVGKGITSVSGFHHPSETVSDLDFQDNFDFDQKNNFNDYMYQQPQSEASTNHFTTQMLDAAATINNNALSRFGFGDQKLMFINTPATDINSKNTRPNTNYNKISVNKNNFKIFHDIPASSLLLTNYDPFYSPLLSRLDAVFQQLGLATANEICREKLVCLMYANPAKYAPYSNLVSAQLSRELNELRKPTSDNPDILRFFKYMKSAKNGQDGVNCEKVYGECTSFKDSENPAMLTTFHEINKLVQARKFMK